MHSDLLIALKLRGFARPEALATMLGAEVATLAVQLAELEVAGLTIGSLMGVRLTPEGQTAAEAVWATERAALDTAAMAVIHDDFHAPNAALKAIIADWQIKNGAPNDHIDTGYDAAVLARLADVQTTITPIIARAASQAPRLIDYEGRLAAALAAVRCGETRFVAGPLIDSYHTVWFELHEELIRLAGLSRAAEAAAGRA